MIAYGVFDVLVVNRHPAADTGLGHQSKPLKRMAQRIDAVSFPEQIQSPPDSCSGVRGQADTRSDTTLGFCHEPDGSRRVGIYASSESVVMRRSNVIHLGQVCIGLSFPDRKTMQTAAFQIHSYAANSPQVNARLMKSGRHGRIAHTIQTARFVQVVSNCTVTLMFVQAVIIDRLLLGT